MKLRIIASALLVIILSAGISSTADAAPWRHCHGGWYAPRPVVRVGIPVPPIPVPGVVIGGGGYYGHPYYGHRYAYGGGYRHYDHGYRGGYGHHYGGGHRGRW